MTDPPENCVDVSTDGGVVTATISLPSVEEREAALMLQRVRAAMQEVGSNLRAVVLDFGDVAFINSSGLAACVEVRNGAAVHGARTIVYRPKDDVSDLFRMVKVDRLYAFAHDARELQELVAQ